MNVPCTYLKIGEIDSNIASLLQEQDPTIVPSSFAIHFDMALAGDDQTYVSLEDQITAITAQRNAIAGRIRQLLEDAEFNGSQLKNGDAATLISQAERMLEQVRDLRRQTQGR